MDVTALTTRVLEAARDPAGSKEQFQAVAQELLEALPGTTAVEVDAVIAAMAEGIDVADPARASLVGLICGGLVERGGSPAGLAGPLIRRLGSILPQARGLLAAASATVPTEAEDAAEKIEAALARLTAKMPAEAAAWSLLEQLFAPAYALFCHLPDARRRAAGLLPDLDALAGVHPRAHWLGRLIRVLDNEPYLAIEPATASGIQGRMSGISENFQLNVLLMDVFPQRGWFAKRRVSKTAASIARGIGPQQTNEVLHGTWNLYTRRALQSDGTLPDPMQGAQGDVRKSWIWNEGVPADIPPFDGFRIILLGPPAYDRTWSAQRDFATLPAVLTVERQLSPTDVSQWLTRMARHAPG